MVESPEAANDQTTMPDAKTKRERSLVEFPYSDLQSAAEMATVLLQKGGGSCDESQLAAWLNHSANGGTFRSRLSAAKLYGLLENPNKIVVITQLGKRVADQRSAATAKVEAFLHISLYASLYEKMSGFALPPAAAIERQMVNLGVVATQSDRARQAFVKSASQAGFIDGETGRFVRPGNPQHDRSETPNPDATKTGTSGGGGSEPPELHPFILGLVKTIPEPNTDWSVAARAKWLETAASIFGLLYQGDGRIKVEVEA